jgi:hypothetical protein
MGSTATGTRNYSKPSSTPDYGNNDGNNQKRTSTIMGVAIATLLGLCVFFLINKIIKNNWLTEAERVVKEMRGGGLVCKEDEEYLIFNPDKKPVNMKQERKVNTSRRMKILIAILF